MVCSVQIRVKPIQSMGAGKTRIVDSSGETTRVGQKGLLSRCDCKGNYYKMFLRSRTGIL